MKVRLSGAARAYILREAKYLTDRSPAAGTAFLKTMQSARQQLSQFPEIGFQPSAVRGSRRLIAGDYVIDYDVGRYAIDISSIRHGRQSDGDLPLDDNFDYE
ncbi:type II toxin-antitoxin system RelE/ParE family toxin [Tardiphaga alba]|uniref:Type II toxin-antitoxin system RelE/ParE family toxin n=1 Tax=Tardiphaga alba TaxID=340268 RepID=A0ABX8ABL6_9BRAD|nr:type II toxin-antitoxin system RelE/ParE family toxin [Tardiphaga alba]QUS40627.1 type II toxin-antitoxin system RelE/ParE family toxin [Tardiphaga alba]